MAEPGTATLAVPPAIEADAAVLVVDVSGFTALTAKLETEHGRRAADRLAVVMDDLLGALADIVVAEDGTVIDIVGDSVQAIWTVGEGRDAAACAKLAASAALAMIAHVAEGTDTGGTRLPVRIGIGFGPLTLAQVGGHDGLWDSLVWGPALFDAAQTTTLAAIDGVAVHDNAWRFIGGAFAGEQRGLFWELNGEDEETTNDSTERTSNPAKTGGDAVAWAAELRSASILFVRLFRVDEMPRAKPGQVQRRVRLVQEAVAPHGGRLDKVHADEKGMAAVVAFGLPPMLVGDAPARSVAAAIDLRSELRDLGIEAAVGVATGKVRAGIGGAFIKAHHTIYGGAANLAARCMQACNDEILCDAATRTQAGDAFEYFAPEARSLKGLGDGLAIFGIGNSKKRSAATSRDATPIAGRRDDIAMLEAFAGGQSRHRVLLLQGEVGIGKSRLALHAAVFASGQGTAVLTTRAGPLATRTPLFAWREVAATMLKDLARAQNLRLGETQAALIEAAGENPALAPLTNPLFGQELSDTVANALSDPAGRPRLARRLQAMILSRLIGETAQLVVIEDAHWLDEASTLLAADLHAMNPQLRLLLVGRNPHGSVQTTLTGAFGGEALAMHTVMPLDKTGTGELAAGVLGAFDAAHPLVDWLHGRTRGNPLFARELLRAMPKDVLREGLISPGAWREAEATLRQLDLPQTIEDAAAAQLGAQPLARLGLLKAASVVGGSFDRDILLALDVPVEPDALECELAALVGEGLLVAEEGYRWRFAQAVLSDAVYDSLPDRQRRELHRKAVAYLEALPGNIARNFSAQIAHHWQEAGEPARGLRSLRRAGLAALNAGAYADAINFFEQAICIVKQDPGAETKLGTMGLARLNRELCNAYFVVGDHHKAVGPGLASLDKLWPGAPKRTMGWTMMAMREAALLWIAIKFPSLYASERRSLLARMRNRLRCDVTTRLSDCYYFMQGSLSTAMALSLYGARAAERGGDLSVAAPPYGFLGYIAGVLRLNRISKFCAERTIEACRKKNDLFGLQRAVGCQLLLAVSMGRWEDARPIVETRSDFRKRFRSDTNHGMALSLEGQFNRWLGEFREARLVYGELAALGRESSDDQFVAWSHLNFGLLALFNGDPIAAEAEYNKGLLVLGRMTEVQAQFIAETMRALAILRQGRFDEVAAMAEDVIARAERTPLQFASGDAFGGLCEVMNGLLAHFGDVSGHRARALRARKRAGQFARLFPLGRPIMALHDGQLTCLQGKPRHAGSIWNRGLKIAETMPENYEAARLNAALAALPTLPGSARAIHRARTLELVTACGVSGVPPLQIAPYSPPRS